MKKSGKLLVAVLLVLCVVLAAICAVLAAGLFCNDDETARLPEVRNNGTSVQWKYTDEDEWHDLVSISELKGAAGERGADGKDGAGGKDGIDGKNGADGKNGTDGADGKSIEVKMNDTHIQWRCEGGEWRDLVALSDITGPSGSSGANGADGKTPEFRVEENTLQWRYVGGEVWLNLYDLSVLKGLDGKDGIDGKDGAAGKDGINGTDGKDGADGRDGTDGQNGADGKDGDTPFIGENGNWWIGNTDTGIKAEGRDGIDGEKGDKGDKGDTGEKGDKGDKGDPGEKGDPGQNGSCSDWYYAVGMVQSANLQKEAAPIYFQGKLSSGGLVSCSGDTIRLARGHHYQVSVNGSVYVMSNDDNNGFYSVRMTDGYDNQLCRDLTSIVVDKGKKLNETRREQHSMSFNRIYNAENGDVVLRFVLEQGEYNTYLLSFRGTITITALD